MGQTCPPEKWKEEEDKVVKDMSKYEISLSCEEWFKIICPSCNSHNWVKRTMRNEACKCFGCKNIFWISSQVYDNYKTELVMSKVFDYDAKAHESVFNGMEKPD